MFLKSDQEKANQEIDCYGYCLRKAIECKLKGEFEKAEMWHENIKRSLRELEIMKQNKIKMDEIAMIKEANKLREVVKLYEKS